MSIPNGGDTPRSAIAENTVVPAGSPPASSLPKQDDIASKVKNANTPAELRALVKELATTPAQKTNEAPSTESAPAQGKPAEPAPTEAQQSEPTGREPSAGEPAANEQPPSEETREQPTTDDTEQEPVISEAKKFRLRLPTEDQAGRLATDYLRRNPDWTMEQALDAAKAKLGIKPAAQPTAEANPTEPQLPQTIDEVDQAIEQLDEERLKAATELRTEDMIKIDRNIRLLERQRLAIDRREQQSQVEQAAAYDRDFAVSERKASELYDFASKPESEGGKRMLEIEEDLKANNDPLYYDPNKPTVIAQMVAAELKIAPKRRGATPPGKPAAPVQPAAKKQILPSGSSSTVPPATNPQGEIAKKIEGAPKTMMGLRQLSKDLGLGLRL